MPAYLYGLETVALTESTTEAAAISVMRRKCNGNLLALGVEDARTIHLTYVATESVFMLSGAFPAR